MDFIIESLPAALFDHLFQMSDAELHSQNIVKQVVTAKPGFPCRITLEDVEPGEEVLLLHYVFHDVESPYKASGPIYIRKNKPQKICGVNEVPQLFLTRMISLRGYNKDAMLIFADVFDGNLLKERIQSIFENTDIDYLHIHNAKHGCYFAAAKEV